MHQLLSDAPRTSFSPSDSDLYGKSTEERMPRATARLKMPKTFARVLPFLSFSRRDHPEVLKDTFSGTRRDPTCRGIFRPARVLFSADSSACLHVRSIPAECLPRGYLRRTGFYRRLSGLSWAARRWLAIKEPGGEVWHPAWPSSVPFPSPWPYCSSGARPRLWGKASTVLSIVMYRVSSKKKKERKKREAGRTRDLYLPSDEKF